MATRNLLQWIILVLVVIDLLNSVETRRQMALMGTGIRQAMEHYYAGAGARQWLEQLNRINSELSRLQASINAMNSNLGKGDLSPTHPRRPGTH